MQGLGDQLLVGAESVGVGGVDEVHAEPDGPAQHRDRVGAVGRSGPDGRARTTVTGRVGQPHGAEADTPHGEVGTEEELVVGHGTDARI